MTEPRPAAAGRIGAVYQDGASLAARAAEVGLGPEGLVVTPAGGASVLWPTRDLERLDGPAAAGLRIACSSRPGERLTIVDPNAAARLISALPALRRARASHSERRRTTQWVVGGLVALALVGLFAFEGLPRAFGYLPMAWTAPIGDNVRSQIETLFGSGPCVSEAGAAALDRLTGRLLANVEKSLTFDPAAVDIRLARSSTPNALAAPGGRILALSGLFKLLDDDAATGGDALAGVLAHEIAHARLRHPTRALGRSLGLEFLAQIAGGGFGADAGLLVAQLAYSREAEREADALAREMLTDAGIGDAGLAAFFERIEDRLGADGGGFLSTHPATAERVADGAGAVGPNRAFTQAEWQALKSACD